MTAKLIRATKRVNKKAVAIWCISVGSFVRGYSPSETIILLAQSDLETGGWSTNGKWWTDKNLFGMSEMRNEKRRTRLKGVRLTESGVMRAQFKSLWGSVQDRIDWDNQFGINHRDADYLSTMSSAYYPSEDTYASKVGNRINDDLEKWYWLSVASIPITILILYKWLIQ